MKVLYYFITTLVIIYEQMAIGSDVLQLKDWHFTFTTPVVTQISSMSKLTQVGQVRSKDFWLLLLSRPFAPKSVVSATQVMESMNGKNLKIARKNDYALFYFQTSDSQWHLLSTRGGYLQINFNSGDSKQIEKLVAGVRRR